MRFWNALVVLLGCLVQGHLALAQVTLPSSQLSVVFVDSQELIETQNPGTNAIDGNTTTLWHTAYSASSPPPPHTIILGLGGTYATTGLTYLPRQDGPNGTIAQHTISLSLDGTTFGAPVESSTWANSTELKVATWPLAAAAYVKLVALTEVLGQPWTSAAELTVDAMIAEVTLAWDAPPIVSGEILTGYTVSRCETTGGTCTLAAYGTTDALTRIYRDPHLALGLNYVYGVQATGTKDGIAATSAMVSLLVNYRSYMPNGMPAWPAGMVMPSMTAEIQDRTGNRLLTGTNTQTLVALGATPFTGTTTQPSAQGVATFTDLTLPAAGRTSAMITNDFGISTVIPLVDSTSPSQLQFGTQPQTVAANTPMAAVTVRILDPNGMLVTNAGNVVTLSILNNPGGGVLSGTTQVNAVNGIASFAGLQISQPGVGYTLRAVSSGLANADSNAFTILTGTPVQDVCACQP